jgi:Fur family ferric uptake transcriptional regulator
VWQPREVDGGPTSDDAAGRVGTILQQLRSDGSRLTTARRALVEALVEADDHHVTADDLVAAVHRSAPAVHRSTVYRTLDALEQAGVVEHVHLGHGRAVYHLTDDRHHHLVCDRCGAVLEVPEAVVAALRDELAEGYGFVVSGRHFALPGVCRTCAALIPGD